MGSIKIKRKLTPGSPISLEVGEPAINTSENKFFIGVNSSVVKWIGAAARTGNLKVKRKETTYERQEGSMVKNHIKERRTKSYVNKINYRVDYV